MKKMNMMDASWFTLESRETPMHVGAMMLFKVPEDASDTFFQDMMARFRDVPDLGPLFKQRPKLTAGGLSGKWVQDDNVDLDYHIRHYALPAPGRVRELFVLVSNLHAQNLDRYRPLWECHLIEGLEGGRCALYFKMHHSVIDGVGGMRLMQATMSTDPEESMIPPWSIEAVKEKPPRSKNKSSGVTLGKVINSQVSNVRTIGKTIGSIAKNWRTPEGAMAPYQAPRSMINTRVSGARRFAAQSFDINRMKEAGKPFDATLNDVVLAMCSAALRDYLQEHAGLPAKPMVANCPVSIRPSDSKEEGGNAFSMILCNLATTTEDVAERMAKIKESMAKGKDHLSSMTSSEIMNYTTMINLPFSIGQIIKSAGKLPMYNIVISNVPGPREKLFFQGIEMEAMYPLSLVFEGQALNITLTSYVDTLDFGLIGCPEQLPGMQRLLSHLENALEEIEAVGAKL